MEQWVRIWFDENHDIVRCEPVPPRAIYREPDPIGWNNGKHQRGPICTRHFPVHHCDCRTCNLTINQRIALHEMKTYRCHKIVQACKILRVDCTSQSVVMELDDGKNTHITAIPPGQFSAAVAGDYYVLYEDGYASRSPAAAFEAGYTEVKPENHGMYFGEGHVPTERSLQLAAQAWCGPDTSHIQMDSRLAYEFAKILDRELLKKTA